MVRKSDKKQISRTGIEPVTDGCHCNPYGGITIYSPPLCQLSYREMFVNTLDEDRTHDLGFIRPTL